MGGGPSYEADAPRRTDVRLLQDIVDIGAAGAANGGLLADTGEFCALRHEVPFVLVMPTAPSVGDPVTLLRADPGPPVVVGGTGPIGVVVEAWASPLRGCLALDWVLGGVIDSIDPKAGVGIIVIEGTR
jgi:hypothetical protein